MKGDNPLTIYHYPEMGLYLYASTEGLLFSALKTLGMEEIEPEVIQPEEGEILRIDRHGEQSYAQFSMMDSWSAWTPPVWEAAHAFGRRQWPYDFRAEYIQELKHIAGCCGYSAEEIDGLLADGYTTDDIEAMLY